MRLSYIVFGNLSFADCGDSLDWIPRFFFLHSQPQLRGGFLCEILLAATLFPVLIEPLTEPVFRAPPTVRRDRLKSEAAEVGEQFSVILDFFVLFLSAHESYSA